jgi:hypothetical protein
MKTLGRIAAVPDVRPRSQRLLAALLVSGVVGILAAIAVPLYANI